ncbi:MFS transporter [Fusarium albosuccineum]|uniref:MFS transporter n=1 Tax=Fusarium albosuccineum TaxID=1237068 RepID=A0A8H4L424_9HYPO|nr:MFS transporter [Fusarium albosuccineum]
MDNAKASCDVEMAENASSRSGEVLTEEQRAIEKRLVRKIDSRLLPLTAGIYLLCYLDRSNIGNAKIMNSDTGDDIMQTLNLSSKQYIIALMVFLVAYSVFEAPSNMALKILTPRRWLGFLIIAFGALCAGIGGVTKVTGLTALRFFLGASEAGVFPGMIYYLTFWYKPDERALRIAGFLCSSTLAGAFGGSIAYGVGHMNGAGGLEAWRWLLILEGVPSVIVGVYVFFFLTNYPKDASWLTPEEKEVQSLRMGSERDASEQKINWMDAKATLKDVRLYAHYLAYTGIGCGVASLSLFAPTIVLGLGFQGLRAQLFTVPPYAFAYFYTILFAYLSDRLQNRGLVAGATCTVGTICFLVLGLLPGEAFLARYVILCLATAGVFGGLPALCAWVGDNVTNTTAMSIATGMNIAFSGPGQIAGVWIYRAQDAPLYRLGHLVNAGFLAMTTLLCFGLTIYYRKLNSKLVSAGERPYYKP